MRTRRIDEEEIRRLDPEGTSFFNMNTPEDYAEAHERWNEASTPGAAPDGSIQCTVELFGAARLLTSTSEISLGAARGSHVLRSSLGRSPQRLPVFVGRVITPIGPAGGRYACNVNGLDSSARRRDEGQAGDNIVILSADAGA